MRYRTQGKSALETRIDYVESKLDESIGSFKEAMLRMESRHQANFAELKISLEKAIAKAESSRNWVVGPVITVALTIIGIMLANGLQIQT